MKKLILLSLMISLIFGSCTQETKSPIEGAWQMVAAKWGAMEETFPGQITGADIKIWTADCFAFVGKFQMDTVKTDNFGWGKYKFTEGVRYEENVVMHNINPGLEGQTIRMLLEIRNDTLIQRWPVDENWNLVEDHSTEKYTRVK